MPATKVHPNHLLQNDLLKTKVVCTVGPSSSSKEMISKMVEAGMNVMRINMAHATHEFATRVIKDLRDYIADQDSTAEVAVWLDINGPKIRTGPIKGGSVRVVSGSQILIVNGEIEGDETKFSTSYPKEILKAGEKIYIDDGYLCFTVNERTAEGLVCTVETSGHLGSNKGIVFPQHYLEDLPAISERDKVDIQFAIEAHADYVSISCIRSIDDVEEAR